MSHSNNSRAKTPPVKVTDLDQMAVVHVAPAPDAANGDVITTSRADFSKMSLEKKTDKLFDMIQALLPLVEKVSFLLSKTYRVKVPGHISFLMATLWLTAYNVFKPSCFRWLGSRPHWTLTGPK